MRRRILLFLLIFLMMFSLTSCRDLNKHEGEVKTPSPVKSTNNTDGDNKSSKSTPGTIFTVENNDDLAAVLLTKNEFDPIIKEFVEKYIGKTIEFNGNIISINNHNNYKTRYDILILAGDYSKTHVVGPNFQLSDVGVSDLGIKDLYLPKFVSAGNNIHIIAKVEKYDEKSGLFKLDPISIKAR